MVPSFDSIMADHLDSMGDMVSGLILDGSGETGHSLANKLWKVAGFLRERDARYRGESTWQTHPLIESDDGDS
jgi:hypothetical protein